ncbi:Small RNA-binding protein 11, chloroplastic [Linum grandiflorum]
MQSAIRSISSTNPNYAATCQFFSRHFSSRLFVREEMLANTFSKFGNVVQAQVIMGKDKKKSKGFGYVTFESEEQAHKAQTSMNGKTLHGRVVFVDDVDNALENKVEKIAKREQRLAGKPADS